MFRSIEETTAKLKSLDVTLLLEADYSTHPITIIFNSKTVTLPKGRSYINLSLQRIDQKEKVLFSGFVPHDKKQKVACSIKYADKTLDSTCLSSFSMSNNLYVENVKLSNYNVIYFNGLLTLTFFKEWFECNILGGATLTTTNDNFFISWRESYVENTYEDCEVICIGDSFTQGDGVGENENWPQILSKNLKVDCSNLGVPGMSADGCLLNARFVIENFKQVKKIICLLPTRYRKLFHFDFLDMHGLIPISIHNHYNILPSNLKDDIEKFVKNIVTNDEISKENWIHSAQTIIDICGEKDIKCFLSTWDEDMYNLRPDLLNLPKFPNLDLFKERAIDGHHPHKKHYDFFVNQIKLHVNRQ